MKSRWGDCSRADCDRGAAQCGWQRGRSPCPAGLPQRAGGQQSALAVKSRPRAKESPPGAEESPPGAEESLNLPLSRGHRLPPALRCALLPLPPLPPLPRRHLNIRGKSATLPAITEKDWADIKFGWAECGANRGGPDAQMPTHVLGAPSAALPPHLVLCGGTLACMQLAPSATHAGWRWVWITTPSPLCATPRSSPSSRPSWRRRVGGAACASVSYCWRSLLRAELVSACSACSATHFSPAALLPAPTVAAALVGSGRWWWWWVAPHAHACACHAVRAALGPARTISKTQGSCPLWRGPLPLSAGARAEPLNISPAAPFGLARAAQARAGLACLPRLRALTAWRTWTRFWMPLTGPWWRGGTWGRSCRWRRCAGCFASLGWGVPTGQEKRLALLLRRHWGTLTGRADADWAGGCL